MAKNSPIYILLLLISFVFFASSNTTKHNKTPYKTKSFLMLCFYFINKIIENSFNYYFLSPRLNRKLFCDFLSNKQYAYKNLSQRKML